MGQSPQAWLSLSKLPHRKLLLTTEQGLGRRGSQGYGASPPRTTVQWQPRLSGRVSPKQSNYSQTNPRRVAHKSGEVETLNVISFQVMQNRWSQVGLSKAVQAMQHHPWAIDSKSFQSYIVSAMSSKVKQTHTAASFPWQKTSRRRHPRTLLPPKPIASSLKAKRGRPPFSAARVELKARVPAVWATGPQPKLSLERRTESSLQNVSLSHYYGHHSLLAAIMKSLACTCILLGSRSKRSFDL
jgi:hypothetical protein